MDEDIPKYALPRELLIIVSEARSVLENRTEGVDGTTIVRLEDGWSIGAHDLEDFLEPVSARHTLKSIKSDKPFHGKISFQDTSGKLVVEFIKRFFKKIRDVICGPNKKTALTAQVLTGVTALVHWLMENFGIKEELAKAFAAAILIAILTATKGAFCEMTEERALKAVLSAK